MYDDSNFILKAKDYPDQENASLIPFVTNKNSLIDMQSSVKSSL